MKMGLLHIVGANVMSPYDWMRKQMISMPLKHQTLEGTNDVAKSHAKKCKRSRVRAAHVSSKMATAPGCTLRNRAKPSAKFGSGVSSPLGSTCTQDSFLLTCLTQTRF